MKALKYIIGIILITIFFTSMVLYKLGHLVPVPTWIENPWLQNLNLLKKVIGTANTSSSSFTPGGMFSSVTSSIHVNKIQNILQPIITADMMPQSIRNYNINGPSMIRVPSFVKNPLGTYYLYFAHHDGTAIHMAFSNNVGGPYHLPNGTTGVLRLEQVLRWDMCRYHIASPDVIINEEKQEFRMYFHCPSKKAAKNEQSTYVALSENGIFFSPLKSTVPLGLFYWRVFRYSDYWYAMARGGWLYRSTSGLDKFEKFPKNLLVTNTDMNGPKPRHVAIHLTERNILYIYYSNIGDAPERILRREIDLKGNSTDWSLWKDLLSPVTEVLKPEEPWEGSDLPITTSKEGPATPGGENALRDPAIFVDVDEKVYLLYSVAGESGIGIAQIID